VSADPETREFWRTAHHWAFYTLAALVLPAEGEELKLVWGEPEPGTEKTTVEPSRQMEIRVKVSKVPYSSDARESYVDSWRTKRNAA
jgi:hypothetical protein